MIILDIDFTVLPKQMFHKAKNGHLYGKIVCSKMKQPDKWGNEYTLYWQENKDSDRIYVGKGKEYGQPKPQPVSDFPDDLNF